MRFSLEHDATLLYIGGESDVADACRASSIPGITDVCGAGAQGTCETVGSVGAAGMSRGMSSTSGILAVTVKSEGMSTQLV